MPTLDPNTEPMTVDDLLELERTLTGVPGFEKARPVLEFQQEFFGLFGTACLLRQPKGTFHPMFMTNIPNCAPGGCEGEKEQEFDLGIEFEEQEQEEFGEDENEPIGAGENDGEEFRAFVQAMIDNLSPCFQHEKQPRFFPNFNDLAEFVSPDLLARFQGYKLMIIPIRKPKAKNVVGLVILYNNEDSQYLTEDDMEPLSRVWNMFANSLKLLGR